MLTKQDLSQISKVVDGAVKKQLEPIKNDVSILKKNSSGLKKDVSSLKDDVSGLKKDVSILKKNVSGLEKVVLSNTKKLDKIQKDLTLVINYFDKNFLELQARVARIEKKLGIEPLSL